MSSNNNKTENTLANAVVVDRLKRIKRFWLISLSFVDRLDKAFWFYIMLQFFSFCELRFEIWEVDLGSLGRFFTTPRLSFDWLIHSIRHSFDSSFIRNSIWFIRFDLIERIIKLITSTWQSRPKQDLQPAPPGASTPESTISAWEAIIACEDLQRLRNIPFRTFTAWWNTQCLWRKPALAIRVARTSGD